MNPNVLLQLGRERHRDLLNDARLRRLRSEPIEPPVLGSEDLIGIGHSARVIDARGRAASRAACADCGDAA